MPDQLVVAEFDVVATAVRSIVANVLGIPIEEVTLEASLENQLGMDSLAAIETSIAVEERFDVKMTEIATPEELGLRTVGDLVRLTDQKLRERGNS